MAALSADNAARFRMSTQIETRLHIPTTVLLNRQMIARSFWSLPSWTLHSVAVGQSVAAAADGGVDAVPVGKTDQGDLFAWSGYQVTLYKDACERYWHALIGEKPLVYVVCEDVTDEYEDDQSPGVSIRPVLVTIDYDQASASAEAEALVLSAPVPTELYRYMEEFVLQHYKPKAFTKRKRRKWVSEQEFAQRSTGKHG